MADLPDSFYRHLCLDAGVALIATDTDLRIRFWNSAAGRIFGGSAETMIGQPLLSVVPAQRRDLAARLFERTLQKSDISEFDFPHRSPAGDPMYLAVTISPVVDETGTALGLSVYVRDVTRRMDLEREMARSQKMTALGAMAGGIAHHFNNMIGGVITTIDFAESSDDPQMVRRLMSSAVSALTRASQLTQALLMFAEGDRSDTAPADLGATVREFLSTISGNLSRQRVELDARISPIRASFPSRRIHSILERLTTNALEAMPNGGTLRVEVCQEGSDALLIVTDSGVGISSEHMNRLFEPFFTTKTGEGHESAQHVGLGLPVVHGVVRDLGGTVTITSQPGRSTTCVVRLPLSGD